MLIYTTIPPRRDGKVFADCGGTKYEFSDNGSGILVCDVADADHANEIAGRVGGLFGVLLMQGDDQGVASAVGALPDTASESGEGLPSVAVGDPEEAPKNRRGRPPKVVAAQADQPDNCEQV